MAKSRSIQEICTSRGIALETGILRLPLSILTHANRWTAWESVR